MHLAQRTAMIGNQIQSRSQTHGEESVTALDIPLTHIMLDERDLNALLQEPYAHAALFDHRRNANGHLIEPLFKAIKALALTGKIEDAVVTLTHGVDAATLRLAPVKIAKIKLEPQVGGLTAMSCTVQCTPYLDLNVAHLLERLNSIVEVEIDGGQFGAQADLPLQGESPREPSDDDDEDSEDDEPEAQEDEPEEAPPPKRRARGKRGEARLN